VSRRKKLNSTTGLKFAFWPLKISDFQKLLIKKISFQKIRKLRKEMMSIAGISLKEILDQEVKIRP